MYLMQFLNFCDRQDGNVIVKNVSPLQMKNIDLEYIPNDDHVEEKKYIYRFNANLSASV